MTISSADVQAITAQLGREPRSVRRVAHRCPCGLPDVIETEPELADGTPFPTFWYLTCPRLVSAISTLESSGVMRELAERLDHDPELAQEYRAAHGRYLRARQEIAAVPQLDGVSAGGMPDRVKCLHALVAHSLAAGPGANPVGDLALAMLPSRARSVPCVSPS